MNEAEAIKLLTRAAATPAGKMLGLQRVCHQIDVPVGTVYYWLRKGHIPRWRLAAFDKLAKKRRAA